MSNDAEIIQELGGASRVAELLGYQKNGAQRVHNWIARGIPALVKLENPHLFLVRKSKKAS